MHTVNEATHDSANSKMTVSNKNTKPQGTIEEQNEQAVLAIRNLVLDLCMQFGGGHGGSALGMAAIGVALWKYVMRYNPANPEWFDRDRFVLSNGKARTCSNTHCIGKD